MCGEGWRGGAGGGGGGAETPDLGVVSVWFSQHEGGGLAVERVGGVGVEEQLRQEDVEDVEQVCRATTRRRAVRGSAHATMPPAPPPAPLALPPPSPQASRRRREEGSTPNIGLHVWLITSRHTAPDLTTPGQGMSRFVGDVEKEGNQGGTHFIDVGVVETIAEPNRGRLVRISLGKLHVHSPAPALIRTCRVRDGGAGLGSPEALGGSAHCLLVRGR